MSHSQSLFIYLFFDIFAVTIVYAHCRLRLMEILENAVRKPASLGYQTIKFSTRFQIFVNILCGSKDEIQIEYLWMLITVWMETLVKQIEDLFTPHDFDLNYQKKIWHQSLDHLTTTSWYIRSQHAVSCCHLVLV